MRLERRRPCVLARSIKQRPSHWRDSVLICKKCSKELGGGFGPDRRVSLRKLLRKAFDLKKGRKAAFGVIEVACFDLCPKRAVTVSLGSQPRKLFVIPRGAPLQDIVRTLDLSEKDRSSP